MTSEVEKLIIRAIIRDINGDRGCFRELATKAIQLHERQMHLYVPIEEILGG